MIAFREHVELEQVMVGQNDVDAEIIEDVEVAINLRRPDLP
jgi:hypothetical protein